MSSRRPSSGSERTDAGKVTLNRRPSLAAGEANESKSRNATQEICQRFSASRHGPQGFEDHLPTEDDRLWREAEDEDDIT